MLEAGLIGRKRLDTQQATVVIDLGGDMEIGVGVHTPNNAPYHRHQLPLSLA